MEVALFYSPKSATRGFPWTVREGGECRTACAVTWEPSAGEGRGAAEHGRYVALWPNANGVEWTEDTARIF